MEASEPTPAAQMHLFIPPHPLGWHPLRLLQHTLDPMQIWRETSFFLSLSALVRRPGPDSELHSGFIATQTLISLSLFGRRGAPAETTKARVSARLFT